MLQLPSEALLDHILEAPGIPQWFQEAIDVGNPDALLLALKIREKNPLTAHHSANFCQIHSAQTNFSLLITYPLFITA